MKRNVKKQLPYFGRGKKVVCMLLLSILLWIFGLLYYGFNPKSKVSVCWLMVSIKNMWVTIINYTSQSPLICLLGFGIYSVVSISISLLQFSDITKGKAELAEDILRAKNNLEKRGFILD